LYYNQTLLVISEIINDLEAMYCQATTLRNGRTVLSQGATYTMKDVNSYINNIVKHKAEGGIEKNFHSCNHHLPMRFADSPKTRLGSSSIAIGQVQNLNERRSIYMPSLIYLIELVGIAYSNLNDVLLVEENYRRLSEIYEIT